MNTVRDNFPYKVTSIIHVPKLIDGALGSVKRLSIVPFRDMETSKNDTLHQLYLQIPMKA